jgi:hypothetical protein
MEERKEEGKRIKTEIAKPKEKKKDEGNKNVEGEGKKEKHEGTN